MFNNSRVFQFPTYLVDVLIIVTTGWRCDLVSGIINVDKYDHELEMIHLSDSDITSFNLIMSSWKGKGHATLSSSGMYLEKQ